MRKQFSLNDHLFNKDTVSYLAHLFKVSDPTFKDAAFIQEACSRFPQLQLKERIAWMAEVLQRHLPEDPKEASSVIIEALPPALDPNKSDDDFGSFIFAPLGEYVKTCMLQQKDLPVAFRTLHALTKRFSMEDAIRAFINAYPNETMTVLTEWSDDAHYHVRRLVSEGTRPLLPWSARVVYSHADTLPLLDRLYADRTRYVTRSVANHLNDISKTEPALVIERLKCWKREGKQDAKEFDWMTRHALRTLVKKGHKDALELLGYEADAQIELVSFEIKPSSQRIEAGQELVFSCTVHARREVSLMVDYGIDFVQARGGRKQKVFKLKKVHLKKGETRTLHKRHRLLKDATTYALHAGEHAVWLQINGVRTHARSFTIV